MGRKSSRSSAPPFFGIRTRKVVEGSQEATCRFLVGCCGIRGASWIFRVTERERERARLPGAKKVQLDFLGRENWSEIGGNTQRNHLERRLLRSCLNSTKGCEESTSGFGTDVRIDDLTVEATLFADNLGFESHQSDGVSATTMTLKGINDMILSFDCNDHRANTFTAVCPCFPARMGCIDGDNKSNKDDQDAKSKLLGHGGYLLWKRKIDKSNNNSFLCTRAWDGLWFNPRDIVQTFFQRLFHFTANGWGGNEGELFDCGGHDF
ncbi:hypothetical protein CK203_061353 [Vitis vinifera]|uniref:Uncharacterized protein n=1 Tax=Vitis vinifera TaxID=29760 RepID=A0A438GAQ1_VITVI|nr:hypothetical protein CK203_061353 [Vitis vinifera]